MLKLQTKEKRIFCLLLAENSFFLEVLEKMQRRVFARPPLSALSPLARSYSSNTVISGGTPSGYEAVKARLNALEPTEQLDESRQLAVDTSGLHRFKGKNMRNSSITRSQLLIMRSS